AVSSMVVGAIVWQFGLRFTPDLPADLVAVPFSCLALIIVSLATSRKHPPKALTDANGKPIAYDNRLGLMRQQSQQA
ncbi:MAG: hypothetical protein HOE48_02485, partial [Candidatus Latescibacteria bacterium]|nr:hypothetical protein [Candidatus Latescibacterota bacterium]